MSSISSDREKEVGTGMLLSAPNDLGFATNYEGGKYQPSVVRRSLYWLIFFCVLVRGIFVWKNHHGHDFRGMSVLMASSSGRLS